MAICSLVDSVLTRNPLGFAPFASTHLARDYNW